MRLADDARGRVPFALVGIVLLLGSAVFAATVARRGPASTDPDVVEARERVEAAVDTAVRRAVARAGARAAASPVVTPANTTAGAALGDDPFRSYLALQVYRNARRALASVSVRAGCRPPARTCASTSAAPPTPCSAGSWRRRWRRWRGRPTAAAGSTA